MAVSTQLTKTSVTTSGEVVTTTTYDRVSADLLMLVLFRAELRGRYAGLQGGSVVFSRDVKDTVLFPFTQV